MEEELLARERGGGVDEEKRWTGTLRWCNSEHLEEARRLGYIAAPMVAVTMSQFLIQVASTMIVGHLSELDLAASSIAFSLANVTGFSLLVGMASGLETLCGQAYGAEQYHKLGVHAYKAIFSLLVVCVPISLVWASMGKLLQLVGQDPLISHEAERYAVRLIPGLFAYAITQPLLKFLQAQSLIFPMLLSSVPTLCLHILLCWFLVFHSGLRNVGAAISLSISYWLNVLILVVYIRYSKSCKATRTPISKEAFKNINEFLRLALPSALMICLEWWSYELLILLSGLLPNPQLEASVLSILFLILYLLNSLNSISLLYCLPFGLGCAASTRVSNELGAWNPKGAQLAVRVSLFLTISDAVLVSGTLLALRHIVGYAYSSEEEVINYVREMVPLICFTVITDNLQGILSGIARGCGWQHLGAYVNLGAFYLVGIPIGAVLAFIVHLRGKGLWMGILCGSTTQTLLLLLITRFTDWQHQANLARERVFHERLPIGLQNQLK